MKKRENLLLKLFTPSLFPFASFLEGKNAGGVLRRIADVDLPMSVIDPSEVDETRVLCAAGMITAVLPEPGSSEPAEILSFTGLGRATLKVRPPNA